MSAAPAMRPVEPAAEEARARPRRSLLLWQFALALFANAALLFLVQPMFSKMALPLLGGSASVWNTCMLVFQALLLGGYLYAHLSTTLLAPRAQVLAHVGLLAVSLLALPVAVPAGWTPPPGGAPLPWLVGLLLVGLGLPFFMLSTGAPLLQHWFSRTGHPDAANPYFLYAASNAGSMLALLAYPFAVEPLLALSSQRMLWAALYGVVMLLVAACGWTSVRKAALGDERPKPVARVADDVADVATNFDTDTDVGAESREVSPERSEGPRAESRSTLWRQRAWWTLLAFAPSSLLLGVTTYLSTDMAAFPLLWVVPLALYLLTFVLVFARRQVLPHAWMLRFHPVLLLPLLIAMFTGRGRGGDLLIMGPVHLLLFFATAMVCHGELARLRPASARLTEFYLWMSVGGVLGGVFNVLVAPAIFDRVFEYQLVLAVACALRPWPGGGLTWPELRRDLLLPIALGVGVVFTLEALFATESPLATIYAPPIVAGVAAALLLFFVRRPLRLALGVLAMLMAARVAGVQGKPPLLAERSFFGVYGVRDLGGGYYVLYHGTTMHGAQNRRADRVREPLTYYRVLGPLGDIFSAKRLTGKPLNVGVVGLGTGSVACYSRPGDRFTFYEIDPAIERIARDRRYFTYLSDCTPSARVELGDARVSLARASDGQRYDVLVLDAFSSDAIPVHLLTREALAVYLRHLAPDGVIALHISNRYLNLTSVVADLAADAGVIALIGQEAALTAEEKARMHSGSSWVAIARSRAPLEALSIRAPRWDTLASDSTRRVWTDDYSNVLSALYW